MLCIHHNVLPCIVQASSYYSYLSTECFRFLVAPRGSGKKKTERWRRVRASRRLPNIWKVQFSEEWAVARSRRGETKEQVERPRDDERSQRTLNGFRFLFHCYCIRFLVQGSRESRETVLREYTLLATCDFTLFTSSFRSRKLLQNVNFQRNFRRETLCLFLLVKKFYMLC